MSDTSTNHRAKVFISYSRDDIDFADQLVAALEGTGFDPLIDRHSIPGGEDWKAQLRYMIVEADTVVFVLSPRSAASKLCEWEVAEADKLNKRLIPILCASLEGVSVPPRLADLNYIYFYAEQKVSGSGFGAGLARLLEALNTDLTWIRDHTRLGALSERWQARKRDAALLLRGDELEDAERWLARKPPKAPEPTELLRAFLAESRRGEAARLDKERQQLAEIAAAQANIATEQVQRARSQRITRWVIAAAAALALVGSGIVAYLQWDKARQLEARAASIAALTDSLNKRQAEALRNEGIALTAFSDAALKEGHPVDAVKLALAAWPRKGDEKRPQMRRVITALVSAISEYHERARLEVPAAVRYADFSPDGKRVITASEDNKARIWDADTGELLTSLEGHDKAVWSAAFSSDGARALTASDDGTARIWNVKTGALLVVLRHSASFRRAAFSPDGERIVTASLDKTARIWDAKTGKQLVELRGHDGEVYSAAFSPDGERIVTASLDKTARIWDAKTGKHLVEPLKHRGEVYSAAFSPDGERIVTASDDGTARIWNGKTGKGVDELEHSGKLSAAAFSLDGARIITASYDKRARIWDVATKTVLIELKGHDQVVNFAAFSADGTKIVTASDDKTARIWDTAAAPLVAVNHEDSINKVAFSTDGARIVTASRDGTARIWNARTGALLSPIPGRKGAFKGDLGAMVTAAFDPQGDRVVTASDNAAVIWNAKTGEPLVILDRQKWFRSAAFSPDGSRIVTATEDKTARIWDAKTGEQLLQNLEHPVRSPSPSSAGRMARVSSLHALIRGPAYGTLRQVSSSKC